MLHQLGMDIREMEIALFKIKTKYDITVPPMSGYIEEWLRKSIIKITEPY
jgi:hypothetical protein